ncbi:hypothetical protein TNCV_3014341 [Trichonephila clavipes]|nr:hypothetical protein TNCV_3014341 [Trichonephila clavipes]
MGSNIRSKSAKFIAAKGCIFTHVVSFSFEHLADDRAILLDSAPIFRKYTLGVVRAFYLSSSCTNLARRLAARRLFRVPPCRKGTIHLQTSMPSPGFEPKPNGTAASVTNHYTGWAAHKLVAEITSSSLASL